MVCQFVEILLFPARFLMLSELYDSSNIWIERRNELIKKAGMRISCSKAEKEGIYYRKTYQITSPLL